MLVFGEFGLWMIEMRRMQNETREWRNEFILLRGRRFNGEFLLFAFFVVATKSVIMDERQEKKDGLNVRLVNSQ